MLWDISWLSRIPVSSNALQRIVLKYHPFSQRSELLWTIHKGIVGRRPWRETAPLFRWVRWGHWCPRHIPRWLHRLILDAHMYIPHVYVCTLGDTTVGDYIQRSLERRGCGLPGLSCDGSRYVRNGNYNLWWLIETHQVGQIILEPI